MTTPALPSLPGETLSPEQTRYLDGFFAGLRNRGLSFGDVAPNPAGGPGNGAGAALPGSPAEAP